MSAIRVVSFSAVLLLTTAAAAQQPPPDLNFEDVFERVAAQQGRTYEFGRDVLARQGKDVVPFLREKANSDDWRQRDLARALLMRREHPEKARAVERLLAFSPKLSYYKSDKGNVRSVVVAWDQEEAEHARRHKRPIPPMQDVTFTKDDLPLLLDVLRAQAKSLGRVPPAGGTWLRLVEVASYFSTPEAVPTFLMLFETSERDPAADGLLVSALSYRRKETLPVLREAIRAGKSPLAIAGARVIARAGDKEDLPLLLDRLANEKNPGLVEEYAAALARWGHVSAIGPIFDRLLAAAKGLREYGKNRSEEPSYPAMRRAFLSFEKDAKAYLTGRLEQDTALATRAVASGLRLELEDSAAAAGVYWATAEQSKYSPGTAEEKRKYGEEVFWYPWVYLRGRVEDEEQMLATVPDGLLVERAYLAALPADLLQLTRRKVKDLAFEVIADAIEQDRLLMVGKGHTLPALSRALARLGDERAFGLWQTIATKQGGPNHPDFAIASIEGILAFGNPKGAKLLAVIARTKGVSQQAADLALAVLPVLRGGQEGKDAAHKLLDTDNAAVRELVAAQLARDGDPGAVPVLIIAAAKLRGEAHSRLQDAIVAGGKELIPALAKMMKGTENWRERLLCEACVERLRRPALFARLVKESAAQDYGFGHRAGPSADTIRAGGVAVAKAIGAKAVPLFEAAVTFDCGPTPAVAAVFALAHFKQERSLDVLVQGMRTLPRRVGEIRGEGLIALALKEYGEKGVGAAKQVPPPDPEKEDYEGRTGRHRGATEALAMVEEPQGVDNILDGLKAAMPAKENADEFAKWRARLMAYLKYAEKYDDPRLFGPVMQLAEMKDEQLTLAALPVLAGHKDERVVKLAVSMLRTGGVYGSYQAAVTALARQLGAGAAPFVVKRLQGEPKEEDRLIAVQALFELGDWGAVPWGQRKGKGKGQAAEPEKLAAAARAAAIPPLLDALQDKSWKVQYAAANAVVRLSKHVSHAVSDRRAVKPLCAWLRTAGEVTWDVVDYLTASGEAEVTPTFLAVYGGGKGKLGGDRNIASALGHLGNKDAIPALAAAVGAPDFTARQSAHFELEALVRLGPDGVAVVKQALKKSPHVTLRTEAAAALRFAFGQKLNPDLLALFEDLTSYQVWHKGLSGHPSDRLRQYHSQVRELLAALSPHMQEAYPHVCHAFLRATESYGRWLLETWIDQAHGTLPELRDAPVPLARAPEHFAAHGGKLPRLRLLEMPDLWRKALDAAHKLPCKEVDALIAESDLALEALVEMAHPKAPLSKEQVAAAVKQLDDEKARPRALALLAFGRYPARHLAEATATARGAALLNARAVQRWRHGEWWAVRDGQDLLGTGTSILERGWPVDKLRAFALSRLDRLAEVEEVEHNWRQRPLGPLLASVRYSPSAEERELLAGFVRRAGRGARATALHVMEYGMNAQGLEHWGALPAHKYGP